MVSAQLVVAYVLWYLGSAVANTSSRQLLTAAPLPLALCAVQFAAASAQNLEARSAHVPAAISLDRGSGRMLLAVHDANGCCRRRCPTRHASRSTAAPLRAALDDARRHACSASSCAGPASCAPPRPAPSGSSTSWQRCTPWASFVRPVIHRRNPTVMKNQHELQRLKKPAPHYSPRNCPSEKIIVGATYPGRAGLRQLDLRNHDGLARRDAALCRAPRLGAAREALGGG